MVSDLLGLLLHIFDIFECSERSVSCYWTLSGPVSSISFNVFNCARSEWRKLNHLHTFDDVWPLSGIISTWTADKFSTSALLIRTGSQCFLLREWATCRLCLAVVGALCQPNALSGEPCVLFVWFNFKAYVYLHWQNIVIECSGYVCVHHPTNLLQEMSWDVKKINKITALIGELSPLTLTIHLQHSHDIMYNLLYVIPNIHVLHWILHVQKQRNTWPSHATDHVENQIYAFKNIFKMK